MRRSGVIAPMALPGATDHQVFETYVEQALVPELRAGDVVVWDNLSSHNSASAIAAIEAVGARVMPLPAYSQPSQHGPLFRILLVSKGVT
jgi:hypothetical protein